MYLNGNNVAGANGRRCNRNVAGETGRRCNDQVAGRVNCDFVYECLLALLEDALRPDHCCCNGSVSPGGGGANPRRCRPVYECLEDLLEDALEEDCKRK